MENLIAEETFPTDEEIKICYKATWVIPNWRELSQNISQVDGMQVTFETGVEPVRRLQLKWLVRLNVVEKRQGILKSKVARVSWQLVGKKGNLNWPEEVGVLKINTSRYSDTLDQAKELESVNLNDRFEFEGTDVDLVFHADLENEDYEEYFPHRMDVYDVSCGDGALRLYLVVGMTRRPNQIAENRFLRELAMENLLKGAEDRNWDELEEMSTEERRKIIKFVAMDGQGMEAHQNVVTAGSPVFATMLTSDFVEKGTGLVKVDDVNGKSMKLILHFLSTGHLADGWNDDETIVELVYAAGKYQIDKLTQFFDSWLGLGEEKVATVHVKLLDICDKLGLKRAEKRLFPKVVSKICEFKTGLEMLELFGHNVTEICNNKELLRADNYKEMFGDVGSMLWGGCMDFRKKVRVFVAIHQNRNEFMYMEHVVLEKLARTVKCFEEAEPLLKYFGFGQKINICD